MQLKKLLIAGPWVGEFGWELFCWHAYVRAMSRNFDRTVIISSKHSEFLYKDFCDKFIAFDPDVGDYKDSYYKVGFSDTPEMWNHWLGESLYDKNVHNLTIFKPRRIGYPPRTHFSQTFKFGKYQIKPEYLKLGKKKKKDKKTIILHARARNLRPEDNWSEKKWKILVDKIDKLCYNVICVGLKKESHHIKGTIDLRECSQNKLINLLSSSTCILGPSSGAMHLASLCGCPQVVWTTNYNLDRYIKNWNPFDTPVVFLSEYGWQPDPEYVFKKMMEFINEDK